MRLATIATPSGSRAAVQNGDDYVIVEDFADVGALLTDEYWTRTAAEALAAARTTVPVADAEELQLITRPGKIVCVGLNYRSHILEMGRDLPAYPTLFAKFAETLTGPFADVPFAPEDPELDWEGELVVVIGSRIRRADEAEAARRSPGTRSPTTSRCAAGSSGRRNGCRARCGRTRLRWVPCSPPGMTSTPPRRCSRPPSTARSCSSMRSPTSCSPRPTSLLHLDDDHARARRHHPHRYSGSVGRARDPQVYLKVGDEVSVSIDGIGQISNRIVDAG